MSNTGKSQSFFGRIFNRASSDQLSSQYFKHVSELSSITFTKGEVICNNIVKQFNPATAAFFT